MRRIFKSFMLVAAAAMAFTSCQKEEAAAPETVSVNLTMHAGVEETKTYLGENNAVLWGESETVTLYVGAGETAKFFDSASTDAYDGEASASFTFEIKDVTEADTYALGGIYPASAAIKDNKNASQFKVILPATQNQVDGNYDPSAYIMVLKPEVVTELPDEYKASFRRAVALNKITLTGVKEDILSVEITVPEKKYLAGRRYMNLTTGESGEVYESGTQTNVVKVNGDFKSGSFDVWFCSWGVELVEGEALTVKMASANNTYTRTITTRAEGIKFVEGDLNTLTINMEKADVEAISTITGDYLIASKTSSGWFLMTPTNGGSYYTATGNVSSSSAVTCADFYDVADVENYVWKVAKYDNGYSIQSIYTNNYVAYSGSSNQAYANADLNDAAKMDIQLNGQDAVIESMNASGRKLQYNAGSPRFAFYTTAQTSVCLISWTPDATPRIYLTENSDEVTYDATSYDFTYRTKNITGNVDVTIKEATMTNVSASASNGTVTVTFDANADAEQKTATIVLSYEGAASQEFVLTQAGKPADGGEVTTKTWSWAGGSSSDFKALPNVTTNGFGSDYASSNTPYNIKLDSTGDYFVVKVDGAVKTVSVGVKMIGGANTSTLDIQGSTDGSSYSSVQKLTVSGLQNSILTLNTTNPFDESYRYIKFYYTKGSNIGVGPVSIEYIADGNAGGETPEPEQPETPAAPVLTITENPTSDIPAEGDVVTVKYSVTNPVEGQSVTASANVEWIEEFDYSVAGEVSFIVDENTGAARNATVTLAYEGATSQTVTINQAAAQDGGDEPEQPVEPVEYTLLFGSSYNSKTVSSYTDTWTATNGDFTCTLVNWNNNQNGWDYVKAGRKNNASVATITTAAVPEALTTVTMTVDALTKSKINSLKLYVSTDSNFTTKDTYTATAAQGDVVFNISKPVANAYYKIEVDCASGSSNGLITVSKVVYTNN